MSVKWDELILMGRDLKDNDILVDDSDEDEEDDDLDDEDDEDEDDDEEDEESNW